MTISIVIKLLLKPLHQSSGNGFSFFQNSTHETYCCGHCLIKRKRKFNSGFKWQIVNYNITINDRQPTSYLRQESGMPGTKYMGWGNHVIHGVRKIAKYIGLGKPPTHGARNPENMGLGNRNALTHCKDGVRYEY